MEPHASCCAWSLSAEHDSHAICVGANSAPLEIQNKKNRMCCANQDILNARRARYVATRVVVHWRCTVDKISGSADRQQADCPVCALDLCGLFYLCQRTSWN